jgi:arylsulfatase
MGDWTGGFALYVQEGRLVYSVSRAGDPFVVTSDDVVPDDARRLGCACSTTDDGPVLVLHCDGREIGRAHLPFPLPMVWQHGGTSLRLGEDRGLPVTDAYTVPFAWTGVLHDVVVTTPNLRPRPTDAARAALHGD